MADASSDRALLRLQLTMVIHRGTGRHSRGSLLDVVSLAGIDDGMVNTDAGTVGILHSKAINQRRPERRGM